MVESGNEVSNISVEQFCWRPGFESWPGDRLFSLIFMILLGVSKSAVGRDRFLSLSYQVIHSSHWMLYKPNLSNCEGVGK
jgi:hypothetical protein